MSLNIANKLTLIRILLVPVFLIFIYVKCPAHFFIADLVFSAAAITDGLDGHYARKHNLVTNFGKFLDPLADKVLVMAALAVFVEIPEIPMGAIPFIIITAREFMVSGLRLLAASGGTVVAAGFWGKLKTAFTLTTIISILVWISFIKDFNCFGFHLWDIVFKVADVVMIVLIWSSTILTVVSGGIYLKGYWNIIEPNK